MHNSMKLLMSIKEGLSSKLKVNIKSLVKVHLFQRKEWKKQLKIQLT
jgi:hypothetical protein